MPLLQSLTTTKSNFAHFLHFSLSFLPVNFGLETKKSIIHPRSDSSNRSTRFSLSSEKSYSQSKPGIMNDDIEKRVVVNKDGSLSVEMRVRFRLQNDETLRWSTEIKKSPSLTNECCPLSQAQPHYLQHGQSESCSDPDSTSFDPECLDYSSQHPHHIIEGNHYPCCYQRQKPQYDLWENPAHINNQHPVPPPYSAGHTHTIVRHTHSSSSSSSCNSRRVVRCRARLSKCAEGSGLEPSQLIQEEMCVTEQVERTVEVEQNGDTHVEVCRVSHCSEVVALDSNLQSVSGKSGEDRLMMEDEENHPMSAVSSSSHVLQLLKEDQDDDLPPSVSQCSCRNEPSPSSETASFHSCQNKHNNEAEREWQAGSNTSFSHCRVATPHSTEESEEMHETQRLNPTISRASCRSSKAEAAASEEVADDKDEEIMRVVSGLSGHTDGSLQSSFCPHCGGFKRPVNCVLNSRSSRRSHQSQNTSSPLPNQEHDDDDKDDDDDASNVSGVSTKSNKTNLSNHGCLSTSNVTQSRACSVTSNLSNTETKDEERSSVRGHKCKIPHRSGASGHSDDKIWERNPSPMSAQSRKSRTSNYNAATDVMAKEEDLGNTERVMGSVSAKTGASSKTPSVKLCINDASQYDSTTMEEGTTDKRTTSPFDKTGKMERPDSVASAKSTKSNVSIKTNQSHRSICSKYATAVSPCADEAAADKLQGEGSGTEERAASTNSRQSSKASQRSFSPSAKPEDNNRSMSKMSGQSVKSKASVKSSKSCKSNYNGNETVTSLKPTEREQNEDGAIEVKTPQAESAACSTKSNENPESTSESKDIPGNDDVQEKAEITSMEERAHSAMSGNSHSSAMSSCPQKSNCSARLDPKNEDGLERAHSAMSAKSKSSARSSHKSSSGGKIPASSALSHKSSHNGTADVEETAVSGNCISDRSRDHSVSPKSIRSPKINSPKVSPTPSGSPQSPVQQLLPDPSVSETRGLSALSVHSVKSAKSRRSKCSCGAASSTKEVDLEDKDVKSEELAGQPSSILSPSTKRLRKESGGTEEPLSRNSSGSISIGLPEDTDSSDSWKSSVSGRNRAKTRSPDVAAKEDVERLSVISQKSNFNESKSTHDLPIINIATIKSPGQSQESGEQNPVKESNPATSKGTGSRSSKSRSSRSASRPKSSHVDELDNRALSTASSASAQIKHVAKTPKGDYVENIRRPISKAKKKEDIENDNATSVTSKSPCCLSPDVAPPLATSNGSGKSLSSKRKEASIKAQSPCPAPNTSPAEKLETCSESTLSQSLSAADMLKETVAAARPSSHQSKTSKTSNKPRTEKNRENKIALVDLELTPTCLPNASPNEVVSEWLKGIPADSSMLDFSDDLHVVEEHEKVEDNPVVEAEDEGLKENTVDEEEKSNHLEEEEENEEEECKDEGAAGDAVVTSQPKAPLMCNDSVPRNWQSSAAVMKVLLSSSLGRCQSLPEVRKSLFTQL